ncbi:MAG: hypothetical protein BWK80_07265 [Desulfobacteraceae bacterium IS3]|nr:MAG: hypothetical protein BWK80_07265 [Desulfobacteraceae bacterium IS3]
MELSAKDQGGAVIVSVKGKVDTATAPEFGEYLSEQTDKIDKMLIVSMSGLDYISSAGLRVILAAAKKMKEKQLDFILAGLEGDVKNVFRIAGFLSLFKVADTEESALKQI